MAVAGILAVSCKKDDNNGGSTKKPGEDDTEVHASLKGSAYYPIILDSESSELIASKIVCDLRPDDVNKFLYVWPNGETYAGVDANGVNFYGNANGFLCMQATNFSNWTGAGYFVKNTAADLGKLAEIAKNPSQYFIHLAYKGPANVAHVVRFGDTAKNFFDICVGQGSVNVDDKLYNAMAPVDGTFVPDEWNEYEYSVQAAGLNFAVPFPESIDVLEFKSGNQPGAVISLDAAFIYKK